MSHKESSFFCLVDNCCGDFILHQKGRRFLIFWYFQKIVYSDAGRIGVLPTKLRKLKCTVLEFAMKK
jgi:hypothetical protein